MGTKTAKLFAHAGGQAVQLPAEFAFDADEVYIRRDEHSGSVILSSRPELPWMEFMALRHRLGELPKDGLPERAQGTQGRDPLDSWVE